PVLRRAQRSSVTSDLPRPGSPSRIASLPSASRPGHNHDTGQIQDRQPRIIASKERVFKKAILSGWEGEKTTSFYLLCRAKRIIPSRNMRADELPRVAVWHGDKMAGPPNVLSLLRPYPSQKISIHPARSNSAAVRHLRTRRGWPA